MREPAWRIFAAEYNDSQHVLKATEEKTPSYVLTPLGAKVNRMFIVGVLTDIEDIGTEGIRRRARISDPTGIHVVYAETFNPEAAGVLSDMEIPSYAAIVGKARIYEPEEGMLYLSTRAEVARKSTIDTRNQWIIEACRGTLLRINAMKDAMNMSNPSPRQLRELGYPSLIAEGVTEALKMYSDIDIDTYEELLREALSFITSEEKEMKKDYAAEEGTLLQIIGELEGEEGALWDAVAEEAVKRGMAREVMEEVIILLMEKGMVYEPQLGKLKLV